MMLAVTFRVSKVVPVKERRITALQRGTRWSSRELPGTSSGWAGQLGWRRSRAGVWRLCLGMLGGNLYISRGVPV
jgi:hypothetical protein